MRRWTGVLLFGLAAYVVALLATLPAERAAEWGADLARDGGVRVAANGVSGTAWSGSAASTTINGIVLGRAEWSLSPWWLPLGRAQVHWRMEPEGGYVEGDTFMSAGRMQVRNAQGALPAPLLVSYFARAPALVSVDGKVTLRIEELVRRDGNIESANATVLWTQAALVQPVAVRLGDLKVEFSPGAQGALSGKLSDGGGPLALSGNLTITPDMAYRLNATLAARAGADTALVNALPMLGRPDGKGGNQVVWAGRFAR
jgi:general secretion pathway protein N